MRQNDVRANRVNKWADKRSYVAYRLRNGKKARDSARLNFSLRPDFPMHCTNYGGQDNVVSITTRYGVHGSEFESLWGGARFFLLIQTPPSVL